MKNKKENKIMEQEGKIKKEKVEATNINK